MTSRFLSSLGRLYYAHYQETRAYTDLTIRSTAEALRHATQEPYQATVIIDGLGRSERHRVAAGLRQRSIPVHKVRGIRDQADEFIRLADAVAGWVRDSLEGIDRDARPPQAGRACRCGTGDIN